MDCRCGHGRDWHEHYHAGGYCGRCGRLACPGYRRPGRIKIIIWQIWRTWRLA